MSIMLVSVFNLALIHPTQPTTHFSHACVQSHDDDDDDRDSPYVKPV